MTACNCLPCQGGGRCARVLLLSRKDEADAVRLWARFARDGIEPRQGINLKPSPQAMAGPKEKLEPTERTMCRSCGKAYELATYLAAFLKSNRAPAPHCEKCR